MIRRRALPWCRNCRSRGREQRMAQLKWLYFCQVCDPNVNDRLMEMMGGEPREAPEGDAA